MEPIRIGAAILAAILTCCAATTPAVAQERPRARDVGIRIGVMDPGPLNAITDVSGVLVGHFTLRAGDSIRTGVTAILPHGGNLADEKVRAAIAVGNGYGKLVGLSQVNELGEIESPILLTGTLSTFRVADAVVDTVLLTPGNEERRSFNPVVGETNDGYLSDIRARPIQPEHVRAAIRDATTGVVEEGSVGAGTGTTALGFKGGIGTASRTVGKFTVGVLVQTNYGGLLRVDGAPVGEILWRERRAARAGGDGSVMIVIATDAPLAFRELERLATRSFLGIARTGSVMSHGSGDYAIAFSTSRQTETERDGRILSALFRATVEATEEAVLNSLFRATTVVGYQGHRADALPIERVIELLEEYGRLPEAGAETESN
jgi:D-aminopeptidase